MMRGFFAVGVYHPKRGCNVGTLLRSATIYGAAFVFTVGRRYQRQASDTPNTPRHVPLFHFADMDDLVEHLPHSTPLVGVELVPEATPLPKFHHPERACHLLGAEDYGLSAKVLEACHAGIVIPCPTPQTMNVAVAGSIVLYDRFIKSGRV